MLKEIIIIIAVIILVVTINIITQNYTNDSLEAISSELAQLKKDIKSENNNDTLQNIIVDIENEWDKKEGKLSYYIEHEELEKVGTQVMIIKSNMETQEYNYGIAEIDKCIFILEHIKEKEQLNLKNIF